MDTTKDLLTEELKSDIAQMLEELDAIERTLGDYREDLTGVVNRCEPKKKIVAGQSKQAVAKAGATNANATLSEAELNQVKAKLKKLDELDGEIHSMKEFMEEKLGMDFKAMYDNVLDQMNVEAIKTYRNIQAVIVEEDAKQNHALFGINGKSDSLKRRLNNVMIFSIVSFVTSILVMLMQILPALGIKLFG